jgi:hypothetical protein
MMYKSRDGSALLSLIPVSSVILGFLEITPLISLHIRYMEECKTRLSIFRRSILPAFVQGVLIERVNSIPLMIVVSSQ